MKIKSEWVLVDLRCSDRIPHVSIWSDCKMNAQDFDVMNWVYVDKSINWTVWLVLLLVKEYVFWFSITTVIFSSSVTSSSFATSSSTCISLIKAFPMNDRSSLHLDSDSNRSGSSRVKQRNTSFNIEEYLGSTKGCRSIVIAIERWCRKFEQCQWSNSTIDSRTWPGSWWTIEIVRRVSFFKFSSNRKSERTKLYVE